jgi:hypothetical protein
MGIELGSMIVIVYWKSFTSGVGVLESVTRNVNVKLLAEVGVPESVLVVVARNSAVYGKRVC